MCVDAPAWAGSGITGREGTLSTLLASLCPAQSGYIICGAQGKTEMHHAKKVI